MKRGFLVPMALGGLLGVSACGGGALSWPPGATCVIGLSERPVPCADICNEASRARSASDRDDLRQCAKDQCHLNCE